MSATSTMDPRIDRIDWRPAVAAYREIGGRRDWLNPMLPRAAPGGQA